MKKKTDERWLSISEHALKAGCILIYVASLVVSWLRFIFSLITFMPFFVLFLFFFPFAFFVSLNPSHHKLSLLWIGSGKATLQSPFLFHFVALFALLSVLFVRSTWLESVHILNSNTCKMDFLFMCDLWGSTACAPSDLLKCGDLWIQRGSGRSRDSGGSAGGRGGTVRWRRKRWLYPLLKRVVRRALLEVLSRLNGATEGSVESITSVSLTYPPPLSLFLLSRLS